MLSMFRAVDWLYRMWPNKLHNQK